MLTSHHTNVHCPPQCVAASPSGSALPRVWPERVAVSRYYERGSNATYLLHFCFPLRLGLKLPFLLFLLFRFSEQHLEWQRSLALHASFSCSWIRLIRGSMFRESRVITAKREWIRPNDSVDEFLFFFFSYVVHHHGLATANKVSLERNTREIVIPVAALIDLSGHSKLSSCQSYTRNHRIPVSSFRGSMWPRRGTTLFRGNARARERRSSPEIRELEGNSKNSCTKTHAPSIPFP